MARKVKGQNFFFLSLFFLVIYEVVLTSLLPKILSTAVYFRKSWIEWLLVSNLRVPDFVVLHLASYFQHGNSFQLMKFALTPTGNMDNLELSDSNYMKWRLFFFRCAKERPAKLSDPAREDSHFLAMFRFSVILRLCVLNMM